MSNIVHTIRKPTLRRMLYRFYPLVLLVMASVFLGFHLLRTQCATPTSTSTEHSSHDNWAGRISPPSHLEMISSGFHECHIPNDLHEQICCGLSATLKLGTCGASSTGLVHPTT